MKRFYATLLFSSAAKQTVWAGGGFFRRPHKPTRDELFALFSEDAAAAFARCGDADAVPLSVHVANLFELPGPPRPPESDTRPLTNWRVTVDFVCHDIKFGSKATGVFQWPDQPTGSLLDALARVLVADSLAMRGDGPDWVEYCEVVSLSAEATADAPDHPLG